MTMTGREIDPAQRKAPRDPMRALGSEPTQLNSLRCENEALRRQVTELRRFRSLAFCDPLTGLRNRRYLSQRLQEEIGRARRAEDRCFSLLIIDVDDFKQINDLLGHSEGDRALCWVARVLEDALREHDICCRLGGDEFAVLLPETNAEGVARLVERLRTELAQANQSRVLQINLSLGTATWPTEGGCADSMMEAADKAMYRDKRLRKQDDVPTHPTLRAITETMNWGGPATRRPIAQR